MVTDSRATSGAGAIRALNQPIPLVVEVGGDGIPMALKLRGRWVEVESVPDQWRVDDEWWREQPVSRMYYECIVDKGLKVTVFHDIIAGLWCKQRV